MAHELPSPRPTLTCSLSNNHTSAEPSTVHGTENFRSEILAQEKEISSMVNFTRKTIILNEENEDIPVAKK
jgi:hypothetical protein